MLTWILSLGLDVGGIDLPWWIGVPPSMAGIYSGAYWLFDRCVWRWGALRKIEFVKVPDLNGKWEGSVQSSYDDYSSAQCVSVVILQRWSKMSIRLDSMSSRSRSIAATLRTDHIDPELSYLYVNDPRSNAQDTMNTHKGTTILNLSGSTLEGDYYTDRGRREIGTITLDRV